MTDFAVARMTKQLDITFRNELRDKILDNMKLDNMKLDNMKLDNIPNIDIITEYVSKLQLNELLHICKIAEVLDWQHVGRIISVMGETYV